MSYAPFALLTITVLVAPIGACTPEFTGQDDADDPTLRDCPGCTLNSPAINNAKFPALHLGGLPNDDGVSLLGLFDPATMQTYDVGTNSLEDLTALDGLTVVAEGDELVGWTLVLEKDSNPLYGMIVAHDRTITSWAAGNPNMTAYAISFADVNITKNVCPTFADSPNTPVLTIIPGQTYDNVNKVVDEVDANWVTFACADEAAYKAKRLGYEQNLNFAGTNAPASIDQQNATLKMITADYCGLGKSFTVQGTPLAWENAAQTVTAPPDLKIEAIWTATGALCLDTPRIAELQDKIDEECSLPYCDTIDLEQVPYEWITWTP
jgi:hypothetical protein